MTVYRRLIPSAALMILFVLSAQAQHAHIVPEAEQPVVWNMFIGQQLAQSLESPSDGIRTKALEHVMFLARSFGDEIDLTEAVPVLLSIYKEDPDEQCRLAAVAGLHAIGDEWGLQQLRLGITGQSSKRVQHLAIAVLVDYYGMDTFEGAADIGAIAEQVMTFYKTEQLTLPFIADKN